MAITVLMHLNLLDEPNYDLRIKAILSYFMGNSSGDGNLSKIVIFKAEATNYLEELLRSPGCMNR